MKNVRWWFTPPHWVWWVLLGFLVGMAISSCAVQCMRIKTSREAIGGNQMGNFARADQ